MLAKKNRLQVQDFKNRPARTIRGKLFFVKVFAPQKPYVRVGAIVGRVVSAKATERNRIKRTVYDFFTPQINTTAPRDILVLAQKAAGAATKDDMMKELQTLIT